MKIGELAKITGCSIQTIRYYEKEKLLPNAQRSEGNFRLYDKEALKQLLFIKHCRSLDITLTEIHQLIDIRKSPESDCSSINLMIEKHIEQVDERISELKQLKTNLKKLYQKCSTTHSVQECGILNDLTTT